MRRLYEILPGMTYDICVLTGDYRGTMFGPCEAALEGMARTCALLRGPVYGVLGNYDFIRMVPELEEMGIRILLNECEAIWRADEAIYLAGIDDAHYYRIDDIEKAAAEIQMMRFLSCCRIHLRFTAGCTYRLRPVSQWPYPWWSDLSAGVYSDYPQFGSAKAYGFGTVELR